MLENFKIEKVSKKVKKNHEHKEIYNPYRINWEFLPEPVLLIKDYTRKNIVDLFMLSANYKFTRPLISKIVQQNVNKTIMKAKKLFIHIPKNAGTSVSKVIYGRNLPHFTMEFYQKIAPDVVNSVESFSVIRNPVDRFLSACKFILSGKTDVMLVDRWTMHKFRSCATPKDFLDRLSRDPDLIGTCLPFNKQSSYVNVDEKIAVDFLFSIESKKYNDLESYLGYKIPILNNTNINFEISKKEIAIIENIYADDFEIFERL